MSDFQFRILGPVEVLRDGVPVALGTPKQRILLVALLLRANRVLSVDRMTDLLWEDDPPPSARANVRTYGFRLRRALADPGHVTGSRLVTQPPGFLLDVRAGELDLDRFDQHLGAGRTSLHAGSVAEAADQLNAAVQLWRGPAAAGVRRGVAIGGLLAGLDERRGDAVEASATARLALGRHAELVPELRQEVMAYPLRERLWALLMIAQYRCQDAAGALATFREARVVLADQVGIRPGRELTQLHQAVLNRDDALLAATPVDAGPLVAPPRELPRDLLSFVGREVELASVRAALDRAGGATPVAVAGPTVVVVVHGPGGVGKSAFVVRAAHQAARLFPDGQLYADLHGADTSARPAEPGTILGGFLRALGVPGNEVPPDPDEAAARFRSLSAARRLLVVLDNAADQAQVRPLLPSGRGCAALVTSRRTLATLESSHSLRLDALSPTGAVALLARLCGERRVAAAGEHAARLVRQCEHLPLAIQIAGARLASRPDRPVAALADELRDERHRLDGLHFGDLAIRSCFQVSYQALTDLLAQRLFRLLGLVRTPTFGVPLAAAMLDASNAQAEVALDQLAEAHLLDRTGGDRFAVHDLLGLFALEQAELVEPAGDRAAAVSRALAYYLSTVRRAVDVLRPNQRRETYPGFDEGRARVSMATPADAVSWLEHEWPSLLTVAYQAADGPPEHARFVFGLTASTSQYLPMRRQWADIAGLGSLHRRVAVRLGDRAAELTALVMLASVHRERGEYDHALRHLHEVLAARRAAADELGAAAAVAHLGLTLARRGDLSEALRCFEESASSYRAAGRLPAVGIARYEAAEVLLQLGCNDQALDYFTESLHIRRGERDLVGEGITLTGLGKAYVRIGRPGDAVRLLTESLERCRETGNRDYVWQALLWRAEAYRRTGDLDHAVADLRAALEVCRDSGHRLGQAYVLRLLSAVWRDQGQRRRAAGCRRRAAAALAAEPLPAGPLAPDDDWPSGRRHAPAPSGVPRPGGAAPGSPGTPPARSTPGPGPAPAGAR